MAIKKTIEIDVDVVRANGGLENFTQNFEKNEKAAKSLKAELRELKEQLAQLPEGSDEYNKIAQRAGEVSDKIGDISTRVKALGSDTKVIDGVVQGAQTLSGAFTVASSASALLGNENEDLQETMLKVESAIGLTVGIQSISNALQKESALSILASNVATKIQIGLQVAYAAVVGTTTGSLKALRVALVSTGVGALVVSLGYLVSKMTESTEATADNEEALKSLTEAQKLYENSLRNNIYQIENSTKVRILRAKIAGKSEKELMDIEKEGEKERADALDAEIKRMDKELENKKLSQAVYNKLIEDRNKLADESLKFAQDRDNAQLEFELGIADKRQENESKASQKAREKKEADETKAIEEEKARLDKLNTLYETYLKENQDLNALSEQEKLDLQKQRDLEEINQLAKTANEKANLTTLLNEKYFNLQLELDKKLAEDKAKKDAEKIAKEDAEWLRLQELTMQKSEYEKLALTQKYDAEYLAAEGNATLQTELKKKLEKDLSDIDDKAKEDAKQKEQALLDAKLAFAQQGLSLVAEIAGKGSKIGKAVAVAQATISGIEGVQNAYSTAQKSPITVGFPAYPIVQASLAGVFAALQLRKILSTNVGSASSGSSVSGGGGGGSAPAPPQFNIVGQSSTNQLSQTIAGQQNRPIQTYVVGNQVSTQQSLDRNAVATSTFG
jgi:NAD(P)-dependent dehydrogenase (short-subunit alcohol dehydrogenase family)